MIRKQLSLWLLCTVCSLTAAKVQIHPFFNKVHLDFPSLPQLEFQLSAGNHASAFLILTHWLKQNLDISQYTPHLSTEIRQINTRLTEQSTEAFDLAPLQQKEPDDLSLFVSLVHIMTSRYSSNRLSGPWAEIFWQRLFAMADSARTQKGATAKRAALLFLAQKMTFFKDADKWRKKSDRIQKKLSKEKGTGPSALVRSILMH